MVPLFLHSRAVSKFPSRDEAGQVQPMRVATTVGLFTLPSVTGRSAIRNFTS